MQGLMPEFKEQMDEAYARATLESPSLSEEQAGSLRTMIADKIAVLKQGMTGDPEFIESYCRDRAWESIDLQAIFPAVVGVVQQQAAGYRQLVEEAARGRGYASVLMRKANRARPELESVEDLVRHMKNRIRGEIGG